MSNTRGPVSGWYGWFHWYCGDGSLLTLSYAWGLDRCYWRVMDVFRGERLAVVSMPKERYRTTPREVLDVALKDILAAAAAQVESRASSTAAAQGAEATRWPNLMEMLCTDKLPDGKFRVVSKLSVMRDGILWNAGITEPGLEASCFAHGDTIVTALDALERRVASAEAGIWRKWGGTYKGPGKGKKGG